MAVLSPKYHKWQLSPTGKKLVKKKIKDQRLMIENNNVQSMIHVSLLDYMTHTTIKGGSRRAEKSRKVLMMMMKAAKLGWAGPGAGQEQGRNRAGAELRIVKQSREERGQELGRNWGEARNVQDRSLQGARQEYCRGGAEAGAGEE